MEDPQMNGTSHACSTKPDLPFEYFNEPTSFDAAADPCAEESEQSVDDSGPSTPIHDPHLDEENDHVRVIKPYAIEEPGDEPDSIISWPDVRCLPDRFERWQRDLTDYMNDLNYQPDELDFTSKPAVRKRGQKRKPAHTTGAAQYWYPHLKQRHGSAQVHDICTKRQKCSKQSHDYSLPRCSFDGFREAKGNESPNSETQSIDLSGTDTMDSSPTGDEMDID